MLSGNTATTYAILEQLPNIHELIIETQILPFLKGDFADPNDPQNLVLANRLKLSLWGLSNAAAGTTLGVKLITDCDIMNILCKVNA